MKRFLCLLAFMLTPVAAQAGEQLPVMYSEFSVGASFIPTVSTKTYTVSLGGDTYVGHGELNYDTALRV